MMFSHQEHAMRSCVLRVSVEMTKIDSVVSTDRNGSSDWVRFLHPSEWRVRLLVLTLR